ncbi:MAG TPA: N-formylglutamate amidohydrolase [Paraburkholderia sp.]
MSANRTDAPGSGSIDRWPAGSIIRPDAGAPVLLVCEHASNRLPPDAGNLGCAPEVFDRHIAVDLGAAELTRALAERLDATAVLCSTSRLYVDCNRSPADPEWIPARSDETVIPGNVSLDEMMRRHRAEQVFEPFHALVAAAVESCLARVGPPLIVPIHSMTPVMGSVMRPWEMAVIWGEAHPARAAIDALRKQGIVVGNNEPYDGRVMHGHTFVQHAVPRKLPHFALEVRQDLIADAVSVEKWAAIIATVIQALVAER